MQDLHAGSIDLNLLLALDALLMERNVTRAAARVGLTQSAMSHKLRRLRELLGDELLVGGRHGMLPTPRAEALAAPLRRGLLELRSAVRSSAPFDPATAERSFTIVTSDYADFVILPRVAAHLEEHAPSISIRIEPFRNDVSAMLESGRADLVMGLTVEGAGLKQRGIYDERYVVILRAGHPAVGPDRTIELRDYLELSHIMVSEDQGPGVVDRVLAEQGLKRRLLISTPYFASVPFMVSRSNMVATLPRAVASEATKFIDLHLLEPPIPLPTARITMTWHERAHRDPAHQWLRELSRTLTVEAIREHGHGVVIPDA